MSLLQLPHCSDAGGTVRASPGGSGEECEDRVVRVSSNADRWRTLGTTSCRHSSLSSQPGGDQQLLDKFLKVKYFSGRYVADVLLTPMVQVVISVLDVKYFG